MRAWPDSPILGAVEDELSAWRPGATTDPEPAPVRTVTESFDDESDSGGRGPSRLRGWVAEQPASAWLLGLLTTILYCTFSWVQWIHYESPSYDLTIFTQTVQGYANFSAPIVNVKGAGYNIMGDHFHPILALIGPVYRIFPSAFTLMVVQAVMVGWSTFVVARTAHRQLAVEQPDGTRRPAHWAGWLIGAAYGFSWGVQEAVAVQFHEVMMGLPLMALSLSYVLSRRWIAAAVWGSLLVFVKEDLGLTVLMIAVVIGWRSRRWLLAGALAVWGLGWFLLTTKVILPSFNAEGAYAYDTGTDLGQVLTHPVPVVVDLFANEQKLTTWLMVLACSGLFLLRSPFALVTLPTFAWRFISTNSGHWGHTWHYSAILMPIALMGAIDGIARLRGSSWTVLRGWAKAGAVIVFCYALILLPSLPLWKLHDSDFWATGPRQQAAAQLLAMIPEGASTASDVSLMNHLTSGHPVYFIGEEGNPVVDYLVVDNNGGGWSSPVGGEVYGGQIHPGHRWQTVFDAEGYLLVKRVD